MDIANIQTEIRTALADIISKDTAKQRIAIERIYDAECRLQNPYLVLQGREEIIRSFGSLAASNTDILVRVLTVTYDASQQTCIADVHQVIRPKALGGVISIKMHHILKLQLEPSENGLYRIVDHHEIYVAQDMISQVPIIGGFYDQSLRNAVGQISMAGTSLLDYTGILDFVPAAVQKTVGAASAVRQKAGQIAGSVTHAGGRVIEATGVPSLIGGVVAVAADYAKWGAASLIEEGRGDHIDCYSPTCRPGKICYSPTCPRGRSYTWVSSQSIQDIIKGAYTGASKQVFFRTHSHDKHLDRPGTPARAGTPTPGH
ncbi:hypothetical protein BC831DRAFT_463909, partial [Entophlyctis helioformis]